MSAVYLPHVLFIHFVGIDIVFEGYGSPKESRGLRGKGELLQSALAQPYQTFGGVELYPKTLDKAAVLLFGLTNNHPFVDGNKRTALLTTATYLLQNGYDIRATEKQWVRLMLEVAYGKSQRGIRLWLKKHTILIKDLSKHKVLDPKLAKRKVTFLEAFVRFLGRDRQ
ncbi:MAG: type II toxin-antitoxin system death-on-curing family toxin [Limnochordia bacterium]|jgi:death-on-curing protein